MKTRIGFGFDVHRLAENEEFILGGIKIPHYKGTVAYSDGDVLIHAIIDALLGGACLQDIGYHFSDSDPQYKGADSKILLKKTVGLIKEKGYDISNIDATICLQKPKLMEFIPQIRTTLANILNIDKDCISIKATTTEKLGITGREEGVAVYAVALIRSNK